MTAEDIIAKLRAEFPALTAAEVQVKDYPTLSLPAADVGKVCGALRSRFSFDYLDMITAVDRSGPVNPGGYPVAPNRNPCAANKPAAASPSPQPAAGAADVFDVVYLITSLSAGTKLCLRCRVQRSAPSLPSVCGVYKAADWQEREIFDMFGIVFEGHPNLCRILTPETQTGHPLRKDYVHVRDRYD